MKNLFVFFLLVFSSIASAQQVVCNGRVVKKVAVKGIMREVPYADVRVLLINTSYTGVQYNRNICTRTYPREYVKTFTTDSKGNYNFSYPYRANTRYYVIICAGTDPVRITIPSSSNRNITVPTQRF